VIKGRAAGYKRVTDTGTDAPRLRTGRRGTAKLLALCASAQYRSGLRQLRRGTATAADLILSADAGLSHSAGGARTIWAMTFTRHGDGTVTLQMSADAYVTLLSYLGMAAGGFLAQGNVEMFRCCLRFMNALNKGNPECLPFEVPGDTPGESEVMN
jgi:hypothetical protein